jgi:flagellar export protein FliJ
MSRERRRRTQVLLDARKRGVDVAEADLAARMRATLEANRAADEARRAFQERLESAPPGECVVHDLADENAYVVSLEKTVAKLEATVREAAAREEAARRKVCSAKTEHKKVESWRDRMLEQFSLEEARTERLQGDELAARMARKT